MSTELVDKAFQRIDQEKNIELEEAIKYVNKWLCAKHDEYFSTATQLATQLPENEQPLYSYNHQKIIILGPSPDIEKPHRVSLKPLMLYFAAGALLLLFDLVTHHYTLESFICTLIFLLGAIFLGSIYIWRPLKYRLKKARDAASLKRAWVKADKQAKKKYRQDELCSWGDALMGAHRVYQKQLLDHYKILILKEEGKLDVETDDRTRYLKKAGEIITESAKSFQAACELRDINRSYSPESIKKIEKRMLVDLSLLSDKTELPDEAEEVLSLYQSGSDRFKELEEIMSSLDEDPLTRQINQAVAAKKKT